MGTQTFVHTEEAVELRDSPGPVSSIRDRSLDFVWSAATTAGVGIHTLLLERCRHSQ
jgi:hypothetical protein